MNDRQPGPRVSVGLPVYNGERFLPETLACLKAQDFADFELIISDNGSTDGTREICEEFAAADRRVRYHRSEENRGTGWNFNRVLELATAPLFLWNAADDVIAPSFLRRCVTTLDANPQAVNAFSRVLLIDEASRVIGELGDSDLDLTGARPRDRVEQFLRRQAVHIEYGVIRTDLLKSLGGEPPMHGGDVVLGVMMLMAGPAVLVPEQLFRSRRHANQGSVQRDLVEQVKEFKPTARVRLAFPQWKIVGVLMSQIYSAPLPVPERLGCAAAAIRGWIIPRRRTYLADFKRNAIAIRRSVSARRGRRRDAAAAHS